MHQILIALCVVLAGAPAAASAAGGFAGTWSASTTDAPRGLMQLSLQSGHDHHSSSGFKPSDFSGLTSEQLASATTAPVRFELRRDAGTIAFNGTFRKGEGAGQFTYTPNRDYGRALRDLGVAFDPEQGEADRQQFTLAVLDVSTGFIRSMQAIGYKVPIDMYEQFRIFEVDPAYVRDMASVGFHDLPAEKLVETRIHGATPAFVRQMRAAGNDLTLDGYIESRIFEVTPEFSGEMSRLGYPGLDHDMLVQFRIQGVTAKFVRQLRELGYTHVAAEKLVEMRIHGVTPEFIHRLADAGYHHVPVDKLIQLRIFNIEPDMVKALDTSSH